MNAEQWMRKNYFDEETGRWIPFDDYQTMEEYASFKQDELIERICEAIDEQHYMIYKRTEANQAFKDWLKSLK